MQTTSKAKLPRTHAYPIGAEALGLALGGCADASTVRFECYPVGLQTEEHAYRIVSLEYGKPEVPFGASSDDLARGAFEPRCEFTVSAVKRALAPKVREVLLDVAIAHYKNFLTRHLDPAAERHRRIDFHFCEASERIVGPTLRK